MLRSVKPRLEALEARDVPTTFTVVLATDTGGPTSLGQEVTATTGDLRYCINQANAPHNATKDTIEFSSKVFATPQTINWTPTLGSFVLEDSHPLTIKGPAADTVTISGGGLDSEDGLLYVFNGAVTIDNLDITKAGPYDGDFGGGLLNDGANLTLNDVTFDHDSAGYGGGLFNEGTATLTNCTFDHDSSTYGGGGAIYNDGGKLTLTNCNLSNDASTTDGGAIDNEFGGGTAALTNCTLSYDTAAGAGGGIANAGAGSTATITGSTFFDDSAYLGGGISNSAAVTLTRCTLSFDFATDIAGGSNGGGGIENGGTATLTQCTLCYDSAFDGGGIANPQGGTLVVTASTLNNDFASDGGGGICSRGTIALTNCTLSSDSTSHNGGAIASAFGTSTTATLVNCTLSLNSANNGGGIFYGGSLILTNTIVAGNSAASAGPDVYQVYGTATTDHDLIGNGADSGISAGNGNLVGGNGNPVINALLGPLQNNGGPTETMALLTDSPAIGHADNAKAPATDQRGDTRNHSKPTDIGAFES